MIYWIFNILIIILVGIIIYDFKRGYLLTMCAYIVFPHLIRFQVGSLGLAWVDIISLVLLVSFFLKREMLTKGVKYPLLLKKFFYFDIISTFLLILFSSGYVPYNIQIISFLKFILQNLSFMIIGFYAFHNINKSLAYNILFIVSSVCGIYGIISYIIGSNPYINLLYLLYTGSDNIYLNFQEEVRGVLEGRVSGTNVHPLGWGQMWNVLLFFYFLVRKKCSGWLGYCVLPIGVINIVLCGSRSALVSFLVFILLYVMSNGVLKVLKYALSILLLLMLMLSLTQHVKGLRTFQNYLEASVLFWDRERQNDADIRGSSADMRVTQFKKAIEIASKNPGGMGYGFKLYSLNHYSRYNDYLYGLESFVLRRLIEQGVGGLLCFIIVFAYISKYFLSGIKKRKTYLHCACVMFCYLLCVFMTDMQGISWLLLISMIILYKSVPQNCLKY